MKRLPAFLLPLALLVGCVSTQPLKSCYEARGNKYTNAKPEYPTQSKQSNEEGRVLLRVFVSEQGYPEEIELKQSSGYKALDHSAITTIKTWCFFPAKSGEKPAGTWVNIPIEFKLDGNQSSSVKPIQQQPPLRPEDRIESAKRMSQLEEEIASAAKSYKKSRVKFIGPRPSEYRFALYGEDWRKKIEHVGTMNYPEAARGKLYGTVIATVEIASDGALRSVEIDRSSGHKILDDAVKQIVMMAAPYPPFPPEIKRDTDILKITRSWHFTNNKEAKPEQREISKPLPSEEPTSTAPNSLPASNE